MTDYRVYKISNAGRIASGEWISATTDQAALQAAHELCDDEHPAVEVWRGAQRLGTVPCDTAAA